MPFVFVELAVLRLDGAGRIALRGSPARSTRVTRFGADSGTTGVRLKYTRKCYALTVGQEMFPGAIPRIGCGMCHF